MSSRVMKDITPSRPSATPPIPTQPTTEGLGSGSGPARAGGCADPGDATEPAGTGPDPPAERLTRMTRTELIMAKGPGPLTFGQASSMPLYMGAMRHGRNGRAYGYNSLSLSHLVYDHVRASSHPLI